VKNKSKEFMTKLRIAIDMDDVMAATANKIINLYNKKFQTNLKESDFEGKKFYDVISPENYQAIHEEVYKIGFFRDIEVMPDAIEVVDRLHQKYEVFIVSAATEFPNSLKEKIDWLQEHFPFISWKNIVFCGDKSIISADIMIDDHEKNLSTFKGRTLMFDAVHNQLNHEYERVKSWKKIEKLLL
jgi:5'-nucleotidase